MNRSPLPSLAALALLALPGCRDPEGAPPPYQPPPAAAVVEEGAVRVRPEVFLVPGPHPDRNPAAPDGALADTPPAYDFVRVVRYRVDSDPPRPARAIALLMPGFLGGAGSYDPLARALVRRSTAGASLEAWAIDRRANL